MSDSHLEIRIRARSGGADGHAVHILRSPAGDGVGELQIPFPPEDLERIRHRVQTDARQRRRAAEPRQDHGPSACHDLEDVGGKLFEALFPPAIRSLYLRSAQQLAGAPGDRLKILLKIDPGCPETAFLNSLPWEFIYRRETQEFVGLHRRSPVIRLVDVPSPPPPPPPSDRLRILVMDSSPEGMAALDLDRERALIEDIRQGREEIEVEMLERASLSELRDKLLSGEFHVFHYMGHGCFDPDTGEGALLLPDRHGGEEEIYGRHLAEVLKDFATLRLVVLNACETARAHDRAGRNPFAGVANALLLGGIPAVVAMQFAITDSAAIAFSSAFYPRLAGGDALDAAVAEGRQRIFSEVRSGEWGTPALFSSTPQLEIFRPRRIDPPALRGRRRPLSAVLAGVAAVLLVLMAASAWPVRETRIELDVAASSLSFRLAEPADPLANFKLSELAVAGLERIELPPLAGRPRRIRSAEGPDALGLVAACDPLEAALPAVTLEQTGLPAGSRITLSRHGPGEYRLGLEDFGERFRIGLDGRVFLKLLDEPPARLDLRVPVDVTLVSRRPKVDLDLTLARIDGRDGDEVRPRVEISDLEFSRLTLGDDARYEKAPSILSGILTTGGKVHELEAGEAVRWSSSEGRLLALDLTPKHIAVRFRGRVTGLETQVAGGEAHDLMPSRLASWWAFLWTNTR